MALTLEPNRTIWQRIQTICQAEFEDRATADRMATLLLPYVVAERAEATQRATQGQQ